MGIFDPVRARYCEAYMRYLSARENQSVAKERLDYVQKLENALNLSAEVIEGWRRDVSKVFQNAEARIA